jgi:hypothetical protein
MRLRLLSTIPQRECATISATSVVANALRIVGASRRRVGDAHGGVVEQADQLDVEPRGAVLAAPQLVVLGIGPARRDGAVDQARPTQVDRLGHSRHELLHHGPARSARLATKVITLGGPDPASPQEVLRTVLAKIMRSRSLGPTHIISGVRRSAAEEGHCGAIGEFAVHVGECSAVPHVKVASWGQRYIPGATPGIRTMASPSASSNVGSPRTNMRSFSFAFSLSPASQSSMSGCVRAVRSWP